MMSGACRRWSATWSTRDELEFIAGLGQWYTGPAYLGTRLSLLTGYLEGLRRRRRWVGLDRDAIFDLVALEIEFELEGRSRAKTH